MSHKYTVNQVAEYQRCVADPVYFAQEYVKVIDVHEGLIPFDPRPKHVDLLEKAWKNRFVIAKGGRTSGKTTVSWVYALHQILFVERASVALLSVRNEVAKHILHQMKIAYEMLPLWMQQGVLEWNQGSIELENGSRVMASFGGTNALRGQAFTHILMDEFAFWPEPIIEDFWTCVYPTVSSGKTTKVIIASTPNERGNMFDAIWRDAESGTNGYVPVEL